MTVNPSLFSMLGRGFQSDAYATEGNHLRWQFDPRLGFPRHAFCVEMRPSVLTRAGAGDLTRRVDLRAPAGTAAGTRTRLVVNGLEVTRPGRAFQQTVAGVPLTADPLVIRFLGPEAHACWVSIRLVLRSPGGSVAARARYTNRGEPEVVDEASRRMRRLGRPDTGPVLDVDSRLDRLHALLARPALTLRPQRITDPELQRLQRRLAGAESRFARVSSEWLREVLAQLRGLGLVVNDLAPDLSVPVVVDLVLSAARIDDLAVTGSRADLRSVMWVPTAALMASGWKPLGCFPAATGEPDYVGRNADLLGSVDIAALAKDRVLGGGPVGAEPLDEPVVPPARPATDEEKARRYLEPWQERLEPWLVHVLTASLGGGLHQSEVTITEALDDAGQRRGHGIPTVLRDRGVVPTVTIEPYAVLVAAALAGFPTARLLGLGCVDGQPAIEPLDYRVRGRWLVEDLWAWVGATQRRLQSLVDQLQEATPFQVGELQADVIAAAMEVSETIAFVDDLVAGAVDGAVELWALVIGVQPAVRPLFAGPTGLSVVADGLGLPPDHGHESAAAVRWSLRQRARVVDNEQVPTGACIVRTGAGGAFDDVRNPNDPADESSPPVAVLPAGPVGQPGAAGLAEFVDRYVTDGVDYRYGVSECDPFGRWSPFGEADFRWDDLTPPRPPAQVTATLEELGTPAMQVLTTTFDWLVGPTGLAGLGFELHLRRTSPPPAGPVDPAAWGQCGRLPGAATASFAFAASFEGAASHDGMAVLVTADDETRSSPAGPQVHRVVTVTATGVVVPYDAGDRAQAWVAIRSRNAKGIPSSTLGGPAMAEDFRIVPPPPPEFPPEPRLATFPDADGRSSFTVSWPAAPAQRSVVYRAGERDLAALAALRSLGSAYDPTAPAVARSAALRAVAGQLRDAFQPLCELLPAGTDSFTDELGGGLHTLSFYTVVSHSPALVPGPWPSAAGGFVAVAVPKIPLPAVPVVVRAAWTSTPIPGVELLVGEPAPASAPVGAFEVYRTLEATHERAVDWRLMRPCGRFPVTAGAFEDRGAPPRVMRIADADDLRPWSAYLYRVVARGPDGGRATRSEPSATRRVVTLAASPPDPPSDVSASPAPNGKLVVRWKATAPPTPAGRFLFEVVDARGPVLLRVDADTVRSTADPRVFRAELTPLVQPDKVAVVVVDPLGRRSTSDVVAVS